MLILKRRPGAIFGAGHLKHGAMEVRRDTKWGSRCAALFPMSEPTGTSVINIAPKHRWFPGLKNIDWSDAYTPGEMPEWNAYGLRNFGGGLHNQQASPGSMPATVIDKNYLVHVRVNQHSTLLTSGLYSDQAYWFNLFADDSSLYGGTFMTHHFGSLGERFWNRFFSGGAEKRVSNTGTLPTSGIFDIFLISRYAGGNLYSEMRSNGANYLYSGGPSTVAAPPWTSKSRFFFLGGNGGNEVPDFTLMWAAIYELPTEPSSPSDLCTEVSQDFRAIIKPKEYRRYFFFTETPVATNRFRGLHTGPMLGRGGIHIGGIM